MPTRVSIHRSVLHTVSSSAAKTFVDPKSTSKSMAASSSGSSCSGFGRLRANYSVTDCDDGFSASPARTGRGGTAEEEKDQEADELCLVRDFSYTCASIEDDRRATLGSLALRQQFRSFEGSDMEFSFNSGWYSRQQRSGREAEDNPQHPSLPPTTTTYATMSRFSAAAAGGSVVPLLPTTARWHTTSSTATAAAPLPATCVAPASYQTGGQAKVQDHPDTFFEFVASTESPLGALCSDLLSVGSPDGSDEDEETCEQEKRASEKRHYRIETEKVGNTKYMKTRKEVKRTVVCDDRRAKNTCIAVATDNRRPSLRSLSSSRSVVSDNRLPNTVDYSSSSSCHSSSGPSKNIIPRACATANHHDNTSQKRNGRKLAAAMTTSSSSSALFIPIHAVTLGPLQSGSASGSSTLTATSTTGVTSGDFFFDRKPTKSSEAKGSKGRPSQQRKSNSPTTALASHAPQPNISSVSFAFPTFIPCISTSDKITCGSDDKNNIDGNANNNNNKDHGNANAPDIYLENGPPKIPIQLFRRDEVHEEPQTRPFMPKENPNIRNHQGRAPAGEDLVVPGLLSTSSRVTSPYTHMRVLPLRSLKSNDDERSDVVSSTSVKFSLRHRTANNDTRSPCWHSPNHDSVVIVMNTLPCFIPSPLERSAARLVNDDEDESMLW